MAKRSQVNVGVIGLGWPGLRHSEGILECERARLHAAADLDAGRREEYAKLFSSGKLMPDYQQMLADPELDAVVICLPNFLHFPATIAALQAGKHTLCEKPPTLNAEEMRQIKAEAQAAGVVYAFGRQMRFNGRCRAAKQAVTSGRLGPIYFTRTEWVRARGIPVGIGGWFLDKAKAGGGAMIDIGIHALDAAWYLMGCPRPRTVTAKVSTNFRHLVPPGVPFDVDDTGFAFLRFDNGAVMQLEVSWAGNLTDEAPTVDWTVRERVHMVLYGQQASLRLDPLTLFANEEGKLIDVPLEAETGNGFREQMDDFCAAILDGHEPTNNAQQALYLMEMLDAMYESSATGREVLIAD
jgi:predicted dehydrogenase